MTPSDYKLEINSWDTLLLFDVNILSQVSIVSSVSLAEVWTLWMFSSLFSEHTFKEYYSVCIWHSQIYLDKLYYKVHGCYK